jgi:nucleotide-binding universal stress UspA family protein
VIGYDGSDASRAAIEDLRRAGLPHQLSAWVITASEVPMVDPETGLDAPAESYLGSMFDVEAARQAAKQLKQRAHTAAVEGARIVSGLFPQWSVHVEDSPNGPAYWAIVETAHKRSAGLVVVGSHGRGALGRMLFGNVAQNVLANSPCSVRIARARRPDLSRPPKSPPRLIVAVDGSPGSVAAIGTVCARTWPEGTEVRLVTVPDLQLAVALIDRGFIPPNSALAFDVSSPVEKVVNVTAERFRGAGLTVSTVVVEGDVKQMLAQEAERWAADCIFLGAKGHSRLERFFLGSVSASVAARAVCSVEVTR